MNFKETFLNLNLMFKNFKERKFINFNLKLKNVNIKFLNVKFK